MEKKFKYTDNETELIHQGYKILEQKLRKLLNRREDLDFDWHQDLKNILWEGENTLGDLENEEEEQNKNEK